MTYQSHNSHSASVLAGAAPDHPAHRPRPASRVAESPGACELKELLGTLISGGQGLAAADLLLDRFPTLRAIRTAPSRALEDIPGIGRMTAMRLIAALELGARLAAESDYGRPTIHSPADAFSLLQHEMCLMEQEELWVLVLNTRNRLLEIDRLYRGSVNASQVRVGEIFKTAIRRNAAAIIVAHSHPSGDPSPSQDDIALTRAIHSAGRLLDIPLLDHLICGHAGRYTSLKERGLGFS
jgi:DNA repair protein RadC